LVEGTLFVLPVEVNGTGPYDFLLDTGAQVNSIDEVLAAQLHLPSGPTVGITGAGTYSRTSVVEPDLKAGSEMVSHSTTVLVGSIQLRAIDSRIRGILGGSFLEHFDFLIDNRNQIFCLDQSGSLANAVKGKRIVLAEPRPGSGHFSPFTKPIVISAYVSKVSDPLLLVLDSGTNVPFLFAHRGSVQFADHQSRQILRRTSGGVVQDFSVTQPQDIHLEHTILHGLSFVEPLNWIGGTGAQLQVDGALPTFAFRRIFISISKGYAILDSPNGWSSNLLSSSHASPDHSADPSQMVGQHQPSPLDQLSPNSRGRR